MSNEYYNPQFNTNMYGGQQYGQPVMDRLGQMRQQQYQPYQPPMMQPVPQTNAAIPWVQGVEGAKAYAVAPGNTVMLMDSEDTMMYLKSVDSAGIPSMRYFQITEVHPEQKQSQPVENMDDRYVTREEYEKLVDLIQRLAEKKEAEYDG